MTKDKCFSLKQNVHSVFYIGRWLSYTLTSGKSGIKATGIIVGIRITESQLVRSQPMGEEKMWKAVSGRFCFTRPQLDIVYFISIHILLARKQSHGSWWLGKRAKKSKTSVWHTANSLPVLCLVAQSCSTLCDPMDCSLSGSNDHGIFQTRILEWIAIPFSRRSSWSRDRT